MARPSAAESDSSPAIDGQRSDAAVEIFTNRFLLRDFVEEDSPAFTAYHADPRSVELYGEEQAKPAHAQELLALFRSWASSLRRNTGDVTHMPSR